MARTPRLKAIAAWINRHCAGFEARIVPGYDNTDRHWKGSRLRRPGKGRRGNRLVVRRLERANPLRPEVVLDHNTAETYRMNCEAVEQVKKLWPAEWKRFGAELEAYAAPT